jgi:hypothetical protein
MLSPHQPKSYGTLATLTLRVGDISYPGPVPASATPSRLPQFAPLDPNDPRACEHLLPSTEVCARPMDVFLIFQPGQLLAVCAEASADSPTRTFRSAGAWLYHILIPMLSQYTWSDDSTALTNAHHPAFLRFFLAGN